LEPKTIESDETPVTPDDREINRRKRIQLELLGYLTDEDDAAKFTKPNELELKQDCLGQQPNPDLKPNANLDEVLAKANDLHASLANTTVNPLLSAPLNTETNDVNLGKKMLSR
jgi:hypothetical protein